MKIVFADQKEVITDGKTREEIQALDIPIEHKDLALKEFDDKLEFALLKTVEEKVDWLAKKLNYA